MVLVRAAQSHHEGEVALLGQPYEVHAVPPGETQFGMRSQPAKVSFDLVPGNIVSRLTNRRIKSRDVLRFFKRFKHLVVLFRADNDGGTPTVVLEFNGFRLRQFDDFRQFLASLTDRYFDHVNIVQYQRQFCTTWCRRADVHVLRLEVAVMETVTKHKSPKTSLPG